jgi:hypothetical protein
MKLISSAGVQVFNRGKEGDFRQIKRAVSLKGRVELGKFFGCVGGVRYFTLF